MAQFDTADVVKIITKLTRYYSQSMAENDLSEDQISNVVNGVMKRQLEDISKALDLDPSA